MTEAKWNVCNDPNPMLEFLRHRVSDRKLRLFACGCCRRIWHELPEESRAGVDVAELFADGLVGSNERIAAEQHASLAVSFSKTYAELAPVHALLEMPQTSYAANIAALASLNLTEEKRCQAILLRDVFGNPFRPVTIDPQHLTAPVTPLAQAIYNDRAFDRLPILADALEDAGCHELSILEHCRGSGPHVRGCWVVDMILSKD